MRRVQSLAVTSLLFAMTALSCSRESSRQDRHVSAGIPDRFIGAWRLASLEEPAADGTIHTPGATGMFVFTREGRASVQVMYRTPQAGEAAGPVQYAQGGYEASFGRYEVDTAAHIFTYHVDGALVRSLIGKNLVRSFELSGNQLIVKPSDTSERWRVTWEHY